MEAYHRHRQKKLPPHWNERPLLASFTYLADPATDDKEDLIEMEEPNLINGLGGFSEPGMVLFIEAVNPVSNKRAVSEKEDSE